MLNPQATPFIPSCSPSLISMESFQGEYVVSSPPLGCFYVYRPTLTPPPLPLPPPIPPCHEQSYVFEVAREDVYHLHPETTVKNCKKQEDVSKRVSKQRFFNAFINGCEKRMGRHTKGFRPPPLARRPNGKVGWDHQIQERTLGNCRVLPRNKKAKHPLVPVQPEGNTTIMIRNIPNRYTFVSEPICLLTLYSLSLQVLGFLYVVGHHN